VFYQGRLPLRFYKSKLNSGQIDELFQVIGLGLYAVCRTVAFDLAALSAFVENNVAFFCIGYDLYGVHDPSACVGAVARVFVYMKGTKAKGAVIS